MPNFRRGAEAVAEAATRSGSGKFVPNIRFDAGETKYIQFLTGMDDITTVLMHPLIIIGEREDGGKMYDTFISRRDPALDGASGYDELIERFGESPVNKSIGIAIELEPKIETVGGRKKVKGYTVGTRQFETKDGEVKEVPAIGLVIQSPSNFFNHLVAHNDQTPIEEVVFAVKRTGKSTDTQYTFIPSGEAIEMGPEVETFFDEFDFDGYLEELASEQRMKDLIGNLPDDWTVNQFSKRKQAGGKTSTRPAASTKTRKPVVEADAETEADSSAAVAERPRGRRFSELRAEIAAKRAADTGGDDE